MITFLSEFCGASPLPGSAPSSYVLFYELISKLPLLKHIDHVIMREIPEILLGKISLCNGPKLDKLWKFKNVKVHASW